MSKLSFREDINGLRAWAIIGVVLFHFNLVGLKGGFAGVDVFFVISGFLMAGIIKKGLDSKVFSVWRFYKARAKRIVPPLSILVLVLLVIGYFNLSFLEYKSLSKHAVASLLFVSNIIYWSESGYFDADSHAKELLHTWSLSVEWQYYMAIPFLFLLFFKMSKNNGLLWCSIMVFIISFILCGALSSLKPSVAFYFLPTRAWELCFGGIVYLISEKESALYYFENKKNEYLGFILIGLSYFLISPENTWPGFLAIVPCLGAALVILSRQTNSFLTGNKVFSYIGRASYSIYLWHWPVVFYLWLNQVENNIFYILLGVLFSFVLGAFSFSYVERKLKDYYLTNVFVYVFCLALALVIYFNDGFINRSENARLLNNVMMVHQMPRASNGYCFYDFNDGHSAKFSEKAANCVLGDKSSKKKALLFGDSFAGQYEPFIDVVGKKYGISINAITTNWCYPGLTNGYTGQKSNPAYKQCLFNRRYVEKNLSDYDVIFISGMWKDVYDKGFIYDTIDFINYAHKLNVPVVILASPKIYDIDIYAKALSKIFKNKTLDPKDITSNQDESSNKAHELFSGISNGRDIIFLDRKSIYGDKEGYLSHGFFIPYSLDGRHISQDSSRLLGEDFISKNNFMFPGKG
ncbi:acyltransferase family protein [Serratia sp. 2723]|uniref:acyltransferase family protein n=1 Tax=unclassified Serratia (in: enterobacteria) TaxID=2647522 RepID=UPI003D263F32